MHSNRYILLAMLLCASAASPVFAASLTALGNLPGNRNSIAGGVSDDGSVVVGSSYSLLYDLGEAFRWSNASGMVGLGHLPGDFLTVARASAATGRSLSVPADPPLATKPIAGRLTRA